MFVILGATGNTGRVAAETLLAAGQRVRVLLRDHGGAASDEGAAAWRERGAEVAHGSLDDVASLTAAFAGARGVYLLLPPDLAAGDVIGRARRLVGNAAEALTAARVPHVVLLSSVGAEHAQGNGPIAALHLAESLLGGVKGLARSFLRAAYFLENHAPVVAVAKAHGVLPTFLPAALRIPQIATADIGRAAARALVEPPPPGATRIWNLAGASDVSEREVAELLSDLLGKEVVALESPLDQVVPTYTGFGMSAHVAELFREMYAAIASGLVAFPADAPLVRGREEARAVLARLVA